jgi:hypothetical protein
MFLHFSHKRHNFREKKEILNTKCVFWFPVQTLSKTFLVLRSTERGIIINVHRSSCKMPFYSCLILMKLEFSPQFFEKYSTIKLHENPGSRVVPCGQTEGRTDMTKLIVAFRNSANAPKVQLRTYIAIIPTCFSCQPPLSGRTFTFCRNKIRFPTVRIILV